jgi:hypothetical protein
MSDHFLDDRRAGLENAFFAKQDALLRQRLGEAEAIKTQRETLSAASGIKDVTVLDKLLAQNVTAATLAALSLVPLVVVAWADGSLDAKERNAILASAEQAGLNKQQASYQLFERWLAAVPPPTLLATWQSYVSALSATLTEEARLALKTEILGRARAVAEAAGGFMGLGQKVATEEAAMLGVLDRAFAAGR